jgi:hypothetical protein
MPRIERYLVFTIVVGVVAIGLSPAAQAQAPPAPGLSSLIPTGPFIVTFDENGNATIKVGAGPTVTLPGVLLGDPAAPPGSPLALTFMLPEPVVTGSVSFTEPGGGSSDWLRFTDAVGTISGAATGAGPRMIFYSDIPEPGEARALADVGPPANITAGNFLACGVSPFCAGETGTEGSNGFDYRPGGVPAPLNNQYVGISDAPEPTSLALLASGLVAMGLLVRRRRLCRQG